MAEEPISRGRAVAWVTGLFLVAIVGTVGVMWRKGHYSALALLVGFVLFVGIFACAWVMGANADRRRLSDSFGEGLTALVSAAPVWAVVLVALEVAVLVSPGLGWAWFWRTLAPVALGILAGLKWASQGSEQKLTAQKSDISEKPPIDLWKT